MPLMPVFDNDAIWVAVMKSIWASSSAATPVPDRDPNCAVVNCAICVWVRALITVVDSQLIWVGVRPAICVVVSAAVCPAVRPDRPFRDRPLICTELKAAN